MVSRLLIELISAKKEPHPSCTKNIVMVIHTNQLSFSYGRHQVLQDVSLSVPEGSIYGFLGANGAGKTTMIRLLLGLLPQQTNSIHLFGHTLHHNRLAVLPRIGSLIETPSLYAHLTGLENVYNMATLRNLPREKARQVLTMTGLQQKDVNRKAGDYSLGMKQRLGLAIALLGHPELLILDEPVNGLDPNGIIEMRELLIHLNRQHGVTIFLSSHLLAEMERTATHVGILHQGTLRFQGSLHDLQQIKTPVMALATSDNRRAAALLAPGFTVSALTAHHLTMSCATPEQGAAMIRQLVNDDIDVYQAHIIKEDLEELFLKIIA